MAAPPRLASGTLAGTAVAPETRWPPAVVRRLPVIPERYRVREREDGRHLECEEAPRLRAVIDPSMAASLSDAQGLGERVILLDGAGSFGPMLDTGRHLYNLDHHEGCVRAFTLATCEQALVLLRRGLDLRRRDFTVIANGTDLDTVLAIWVLLNHLRLTPERSPVRARVLPLIRLEDLDGDGRALEFELLADLGVCGPRDSVLIGVDATSAKLRSLRECSRSDSCCLSRSSALRPIWRCWPTRWR